MNFCTSCGTPRNKGDNFCEKCGEYFNFENSPRPTDQEPLYCTKCGKERLTVELFCGNCGVRITHSDWKLPSEVLTNSPGSITSELKKSSIAPLSIILSVLLVVGVSAWFLIDQFSPVTNSQNSDDSIILGEMCDNPGDTSSDGKYVCAGRGAFYWLLTEDLATNSNEDSSNYPSLDAANSQGDFLGALNSMQFGRWSISQTDYGSSGTLYVSNWPCSLFVASSYQDAVDYFTLKVNIEFYAGQWLKTDDKNWIVNDVSPDGECIRYFANSYGGRISQQ